MLKITQHRDSVSDSVSLMVEGKLAGPWVEELKTCWRQIAASPQNRRAVVDLTGVTFVDAAGKALLTDMCQQGARLHAIGCLNTCIVEEITKAGRASLSGGTRKGKLKGS
jgi:anti-anti-sigma regulatory factor